MANKWKLVKLGELFHVKHGYAFKGEFFTDKPEPYQLVTPGNFAIGGGFQEGKPKYYSGEIPVGFILKAGQVIVTMTDLSKASDTLGYCVIVPNGNTTIWLHNQRIGLLEFHDPDGICPAFFSYLSRSNDYRSWIIGSASGTTVKHTSPSRIEEYSCYIPPKKNQEAISHILGTLDDKIELLHQMNETLEAMARALFKSWFIDFDPVRKKAEGKPTGLPPVIDALFPDSFEDSELGEIPKGWKVRELREAIEINPYRSLPKGSIATYIEMKNIPERGLSPIAWEQKEYNGGMKFKNGDTLLARITPCLENGKSAFIMILNQDEIAFGSTEYIVLSGNDFIPSEWCYLLARDNNFREFAISHMNGSSGRQRVDNDSIGRFKVSLPFNKGIMTEFQRNIERSFKTIHTNYLESKTLECIRNLLLPKLISGDFELSDQMISKILEPVK
jgi:Restriction endonuclease S subunits